MYVSVYYACCVWTLVCSFFVSRGIYKTYKNENIDGPVLFIYTLLQLQSKNAVILWLNESGIVPQYCRGMWFIDLDAVCFMKGFNYNLLINLLVILFF